MDKVLYLFYYPSSFQTCSQETQYIYPKTSRSVSLRSVRLQVNATADALLLIEV